MQACQLCMISFCLRIQLLCGRYAAGVAQGSKHSMEMFSDIMSNSQRAERARDPNHISKSLRRVKKWKEYMKEHHIAVDDVQQVCFC